jgi:hypothetical protein
MQIEREHGEGRLRVPTGTNLVIAGEVPPPTPRWFEGKERRWTPERTRWRYMMTGPLFYGPVLILFEFRLALFFEI